ALLSLLLAIGLVVDYAMVRLETIYRHVDEGGKRFLAALKARREIAVVVIGMTLTLPEVCAPTGALTGPTRRLCTEFAWTLAGAVLISGFVALTLSPMMCSKLLRAHEHHGRFYNVTEAGFQRVIGGYRSVLQYALRARWLVVLVGLCVAGGGGFLCRPV